MVSVLASRSWVRTPVKNQTKDNNIGSCFFSAKHTSLRSKNKDCFFSELSLQ